MNDRVHASSPSATSSKCTRIVLEEGCTVQNTTPHSKLGSRKASKRTDIRQCSAMGSLCAPLTHNRGSLCAPLDSVASPRGVHGYSPYSPYFMLPVHAHIVERSHVS